MAPQRASAEVRRKRVSVLFSGRGSNMASLLMAAMAPGYPAIITHAFTNVPGAGGLEIARKNEIAVDVIDHRAFDSREAHEAAVMAKLVEAKPDIICLAGYMRVLSEGFVRRYRGKILNIHPSLLPSFKGVDTHHRARIAGVRVHGATVHFVDETLDGGPIIAQAAVPIEAGDSDDTLAARVLEAEHRLYPHALALVASGKVRLSGSRIVVSDTPHETGAALYSPPLPAGDAG
ncbi:MAG: phosphoribosylglycinamide formyltransferase [Nitratireductor sp.]|nr:phosphoribosylglycinamide formyltransferase [Nitratireductor sp.]